MIRPLATITLFLLLTGITTQVSADTRYIKTLEGEFEDVFFDLQDNIINLGLVVERTGDIAQMLERTSKAVTGADSDNSAVYANARYLSFCSSKLTFKATKADPRNLSFCPFIVYAYEAANKPGEISLGYRNPDLGSLDKSDPLSIEIHTFLKSLIDTTVEGY